MRDFCRTVVDWLNAQGVWGPVFFILLYAVATLLIFFPTSFLTFLAGGIFGAVRGALLVSAGSVLGATLCFFLGRFILRAWVAKKLAKHPRFHAVDAAVARDGWKIVGLLRLSPIFPYPVLNYGLGLTSVRPRDYILASWIGMFPMTLLTATLGSLAGKVASEPDIGAFRWVCYGLGLAATVAITIYITRLARRALRERLPEG